MERIDLEKSMSIYLVDHSGELTKLEKLLNDITDNNLKSLDDGTPVDDEVDDDSLLVIHTQDIDLWFEWAKEHKKTLNVFVTRDPSRKFISEVDRQNLQNCICWPYHIGDGHLHEENFKQFIKELIKNYPKSPKKVYQKYKKLFPEKIVAAYLVLTAKVRKVNVGQDQLEVDFWSSVKKDIELHCSDSLDIPQDWDSFNEMNDSEIRDVLNKLRTGNCIPIVD